MPIILKDALILDPRSGFNKKRADLFIERGIIKQISKQIKSKARAIDAKDLCVSPGWLDMNVRINDPGFEHKETLERTMVQASMGGFTKISTLPFTNPIIQSKDLVQNLVQKGKKSGVEIFPTAALTVDLKGEDLNDLKDLQKAGAVGFIDELHLNDTELASNTLRYLNGSGAVFFRYPRDLGLSRGAQLNEGVMSTRLGMSGLPPEAESLKISGDLDLLRMNGGRIHFSNVSTPEGLKLVKEAKSEGLNVSCDVPFYLFCFDESMLSDYDTRFKLDPPLKSKKEILGMVKYLKDGTIDAICSAHSAQDIESKDLEFDLASFGAKGLSVVFAAWWTALGSQLEKKNIPELLSIGPCKALGIELPVIEPGQAADLTFFQLNKKWEYNGQPGLGLDDPFTGSQFTARVLGTIYRENINVFN